MMRRLWFRKKRFVSVVSPILKKTRIWRKGNKKERFYLIYLRVFLFLLLAFLLISSVFWIYDLYRINFEYNKNLNNLVKQLDDQICRKFDENLVNAFLEVQVDDFDKVVHSNLFIFSKDIRYSINLTKFRFSIDKLGNKGTISDLIETNRFFLDKKTVFKNLSYFFYRNFYIKLDSIIIVTNKKSSEDYFFKKSSNIFRRYLDRDLEFNYIIYTDLCFDDFNNLIKTVYSLPSSKYFEYSENVRVASLFSLDEIKKEQIRIQLLNSSGVEQWGFFIKELLENYGLNVVKLDHSRSIVKETSIAIDDERIKESSTLGMLNYLLINPVTRDQIKTQENIFSEVYVVIGQDSIN